MHIHSAVWLRESTFVLLLSSLSSVCRGAREKHGNLLCHHCGKCLSRVLRYCTTLYYNVDTDRILHPVRYIKDPARPG